MIISFLIKSYKKDPGYFEVRYYANKIWVPNNNENAEINLNGTGIVLKICQFNQT